MDGELHNSESTPADRRTYQAASSRWSDGSGNIDGSSDGRDDNQRILVEDALRASTAEREYEEISFHRARSPWSRSAGWASGGDGVGGVGQCRSRDASAEYTLESDSFRRDEGTASTTSSGGNTAATSSVLGFVEARPLVASPLSAVEGAGWRSEKFDHLNEEREDEEGEQETMPRGTEWVGAVGRWEGSGWESAPDYGVKGNEMWVRRGARWRSRGAAGRRPVTREGVRQLRESERLHRLGFVLAKKREIARRRRDDLQEERVIM